MSQVALITFDPKLILPNNPREQKWFVDNPAFFNAMSFLATTIRDSTTDISIYQGEDVSDSIEEYFCNYRDHHTVQFYEEYRDEMIRKATIMEQLLPPGIYERLDYWESHPRAIYFSGILHAIDYR